jgi:hypothetical protein
MPLRGQNWNHFVLLQSEADLRHSNLLHRINAIAQQSTIPSLHNIPQCSNRHTTSMGPCSTRWPACHVKGLRGGALLPANNRGFYFILLLYFYSIFYAYACPPPPFIPPPLNLHKRMVDGCTVGEADTQMEPEVVERAYNG